MMFAERLLREQQVAVIPGETFGPNGRRICAHLLRCIDGQH
jgi:aspartate/methionine/tyrosine aminotransferase